MGDYISSLTTDQDNYEVVKFPVTAIVPCAAGSDTQCSMAEYRWVSRYPRQKTLMEKLLTTFTADVWILILFTFAALSALSLAARKIRPHSEDNLEETDYLEMMPFRSD